MLRFWTSSPPAPLADDLCLQSDRLVLRPLRESDSEAMFAYASDPTVTRFLPWTPAPDVESVRPFLAEQVAKRRRGESLGLAVLYRDNGVMIGSTDLMDLRGQIKGQAEIGYLLARPYWGCGLMTEAARLTAAHGFSALGLTRLIAFADAENVASRRVLEKIGMLVAGSELRIVKGEARTYLRFERLRTDASSAAVAIAKL